MGALGADSDEALVMSLKTSAGGGGRSLAPDTPRAAQDGVAAVAASTALHASSWDRGNFINLSSPSSLTMSSSADESG